jgi:hypothetical protein
MAKSSTISRGFRPCCQSDMESDRNLVQICVFLPKNDPLVSFQFSSFPTRTGSVQFGSVPEKFQFTLNSHRNLWHMRRDRPQASSWLSGDAFYRDAINGTQFTHLLYRGRNLPKTCIGDAIYRDAMCGTQCTCNARLKGPYY